MKTFKEFLEESTFTKGQKVKVKNAKKYDSLSKSEVSGEVLGMMNKSTVMVKTGSGQMNVDVSDIIAEAVVHNSNDKLQLKAGGSEILITTKGNNVNIFVQEGSERIMFEGKSDDLKAIKDFFSNI
jgi:carbonic anhydrase